jgi:dienelactone hydrolase
MIKMRKTLVLLSLALFATYCNAVSVQVDNTDYEASLSLRVNEKAKRGTVLLLNGCNGPRNMHYHDWARYIDDAGYNAIVIDSFSTRGLSNICSIKGNSSYSYNTVQDAIAVGKWVKQQPWSNGKVSVIGFSLGGITSLLIASDDSGVFASAVAYYPTCREPIAERKLAIPLQIHIGLSDEWAAADRCKALAQSENFKDAKYNYYENTHHAFDSYGSGSAVCWKGTQCAYGYNADANAVSRDRVKIFLNETLNTVDTQ